MTAVPEAIDEIPLYKYRSLQTCKERKYARDILINNRLYCTPPRSFNDPFELRTRFSFEASEAEKTEYVVGVIQRRYPGMSKAEALARVPDWIEHNEKTAVQRMEDWVTNDLGVVSFGGTRKDLLMWSHYAGGHTGICIEFRASRPSHAEIFGPAQDVSYQDHFPVINVYSDGEKERVRKFLLTKANAWKYEAEYRIVEMDRNANSFCSFEPHLISAVYLGCQIWAQHAAEVREWINARGVPTQLFQARRKEGEYGLDFDLVDRRVQASALTGRRVE